MCSQTLTTDPEVLFIATTINLNVNKTCSLGSLTDSDFALISNPRGWLDGAIIKLIPILRDFKGQPLFFAEILMLLVESLFSYYTLEASIGFSRAQYDVLRAMLT